MLGWDAVLGGIARITVIAVWLAVMVYVGLRFAKIAGRMFDDDATKGPK